MFITQSQVYVMQSSKMSLCEALLNFKICNLFVKALKEPFTESFVKIRLTVLKILYQKFCPAENNKDSIKKFHTIIACI